MIDCLGPAFSKTPRISTWNSSTVVPEKTVLPTPLSPGRISADWEKFAARAEAARPKPRRHATVIQ